MNPIKDHTLCILKELDSKATLNAEEQHLHDALLIYTTARKTRELAQAKKTKLTCWCCEQKKPQLPYKCWNCGKERVNKFPMSENNGGTGIAEMDKGGRYCPNCNADQ